MIAFRELPLYLSNESAAMAPNFDVVFTLGDGLMHQAIVARWEIP